MKQIEQAIHAEDKSARRVTPEELRQNIVDEFYFTAAQGISAAYPIPAHSTDLQEGLKLLTFCVLVLRNGTKIVGVNYGAIDPAQHNPERGKVEARADAIEQVWPLMGYELRSKLALEQDRAARRPNPAHGAPKPAGHNPVA